jgi:NTP pyrophosphatase (non-canonical NTP hydrolase)
MLCAMLWPAFQAERKNQPMKIQSLQGYEREVKRLFGAHEKEISAYALGLAGEVGEVVDLLKKSWGHGHPLDSEKLKKELGDSLWYVVALALQFNIGIATITPRRLIDDIGTEHRGQRPLYLTVLVGRVNCRLTRFWYGDAAHDLAFQKRFARELMTIFDQLEQLGLEHGLSLLDILQANVDKLRLRYPEGFSTAASIARVDVERPLVFAGKSGMFTELNGVAVVPTTVSPPRGVTTVGYDTKSAIDRFVAIRPTCSECSIGPNGHQPGCTV